MKTNLILWAWLMSFGAVSLPQGLADDAYYHLPATTLKLTEGTWPIASPDEAFHWRHWRLTEIVHSYAVLDGPGEAYVTGEPGPSWAWVHDPDDVPEPGGTALVIRAPVGRDVTGRLFVRRADLSGLVPLRFHVPAAEARSEAREKFLAAKQAHYRALQDRGIPGAAWFRHQADAAAMERGVSPGADSERPRPFNRSGATELEDTYDLFTGGRALSENLQLDRALPPLGANEQTVPLSEIVGITVREMDWKPLLQEGASVALDPLALHVPADQHALFFPTFDAMIRLMDEAETNGTPVLQWLEPRAEDAGTRGRYQRQLCLGLSEISRLLGPLLIQSVAFTGSDPYLRVGTDVAVLFETRNPTLLRTHVLAQQTAVRQAHPDVQPVSGDVAGVSYSGVISPDRRISSYLAVLTNTVIVGNSRGQLERLVRTTRGDLPAMASLDEYRYFRQRYPRQAEDEAAFLVLTDAAIRRWCGPEWRIADSRRTRAAAVMAELTATHLEPLAAGKVNEVTLTPPHPVPGGGELKLTRTGVWSAVYGSPDFMTPILELGLTRVTRAEAEAYARWRDNYQRNWQQYFDPIAIRFSLTSTRLGADLTVMPLILGTEYRWFLETTLGARMEPSAGDPHTNALTRLAVALNPKSDRFREGSSFLSNMVPGLKANPLGWLGSAITLYADDAPFWDELRAATNAETFLEDRYLELPLALHLEVRNSLGAVAFLTAARAFIEQTAPQMTAWENLEHQGRAYVKVGASAQGRAAGEEEWKLFYALTPQALTLTPSEALIHRVLERQPGENAPPPSPPQASRLWLGGNLGFMAERRFLQVVETLTRDDYQFRLQQLSWGNLPILNEWRRLHPGQDATAFHEAWWGVKLLCPGGGTYVWNPEWHTFASTVFGHPGEPKSAPATPLSQVGFVNLGITFEHQGLSARALLERPAP